MAFEFTVRENHYKVKYNLKNIFNDLSLESLIFKKKTCFYKKIILISFYT